MSKEIRLSPNEYNFCIYKSPNDERLMVIVNISPLEQTITLFLPKASACNMAKKLRKAKNPYIVENIYGNVLVLSLTREIADTLSDTIENYYNM